MIIRLALEEDLFTVLQRMSARLDLPLNELTAVALREWAIGQGLLPPDAELDEDSPTEGSA